MWAYSGPSLPLSLSCKSANVVVKPACTVGDFHGRGMLASGLVTKRRSSRSMRVMVAVSRRGCNGERAAGSPCQVVQVYYTCTHLAIRAGEARPGS